MIRHFFRVIWFRKKENFMTSLGIFISFIVLFLVTSFLVYTANNYLKPVSLETLRVLYDRYTKEQVLVALKISQQEKV